MINTEEKEYLIELLKSGENIPEDFKYKLFPTTQKEYELAYAGKMRKEDVLANEDGVFPVPLQVEKVFNGDEYKAFDDGWKNLMVFGDNLQFLKTIYENKDPLVKDKIKGKVKLIYIDPPFATADEFQNKEGAKAYNDKKKGAEFVEFLRKRLIVAREILADDGSIFVHLDQKMSHYIKVLMDEIFGKQNFQNEIVWHYQAGTAPKKGFAKKHDNIFFYVKNSGKNIFTPIRLLVKDESIYPKIDENGRKYRMSGNNNATRYYADDGRKADDIWTWLDRKENNIVQVFHALPENIDYPTQKPEKLIERIIKATTNKNDIILDFFGGSGTTMATAEKLGRKWITCDLGKLSFFTMQKRILQIQKSKDLENPKKKYDKKAKSFITASLGSYDLEKTLTLEWGKYKDFVAGLFEIELKKHKISGYEFEGKKGNYPVIIFDYNKFKEACVDEDYIDELHRNFGKKVGGRVYIVAPANNVDSMDDYFEKDDTKYFLLKIPYHLINELHKKPFVKVRQPQSKKNVNDLDEVVGFHFKRPPEVKIEIKKETDKIKVFIKSFKSGELRAEKTQNEKTLENFETLSAVFIDTNYNGKSFEMEESFFADELLPKKSNKKNDENLQEKLKELSKNGIEIILQKKNIGEKIMVVSTDIYGNDSSQTFTI